MSLYLFFLRNSHVFCKIELWLTETELVVRNHRKNYLIHLYRNIYWALVSSPRLQR